MIDSEDRLRDMLARRADRIHSTLTVSDIRDAGIRNHRHRLRLLAPALIAAVVAIVVVVIALVGQSAGHPVPPAGPGPHPDVSRSMTRPPAPATTTRTVPASTSQHSAVRPGGAPTVTGSTRITATSTAVQAPASISSPTGR